MYYHREAMRKFRSKHEYLYTMLGAFMAALTVMISLMLLLLPPCFMVLMHWSCFLTYLITVPLMILIIRYVDNLFLF